MLNQHIILVYSVIAILSYLLGSISFGLVLGKVFKVGDIRAIGSGNIGATNALRTGNKTYALLVLLGDGLKGAIAVWLTAWLAPRFYPAPPVNVFEYVPPDYATAGLWVAGIAAMIGHIFPVWLRFKGGKGVATGLFVLLAFHWPIGLAVAVTWLLTAYLSRKSSLAALIAFAHAPVYARVWQPETGLGFVPPAIIIALLIFFTHRENIKRLVRGEESTIKLKKAE